MIRTHCVLCKKTPLEFFYKIHQFPLLTLPTEAKFEEDKFHDIEYGYCSSCSSIQLINLMDPKKLYDYPNKSSLTPLWEEHHRAFVKFIEEDSPKETELCELGGANNPLLQYFSKELKYTVLDLHEPKEKHSEINYILGNIESFTDYTIPTILLSHTFEHLYNPRDFIETIQKSCIQKVFISVPNMESLLNKKTSVSIVFSEHTFYFEVKDIVSMFSQFGFSCKRLNYFKEHSLFFSFERDESTSLLPILVNHSTKEKFLDHFYGKEKRIQAIDIQTPFYIMPSHYIGQMVYHFSDKKEKILGFLDNDRNKTGKRLYGTVCQTYLPTAERLVNATVLLVSNPYKKEMKEQLLSLCSSVNIIECET